MSVVTHDVGEHGRPTNELLRLFGDLGGLRPVSNWGGMRESGRSVWGGVYNHFDRDALLSAFGAVPWQKPDNVVVLIAEDTDTRFQVWSYAGGTLCQRVDGNPLD